jgi:hypothetical protein
MPGTIQRAFQRRVVDHALETSIALPGGASTTVTLPYIDISGTFPAPAGQPAAVFNEGRAMQLSGNQLEVSLAIPALSATMVPNGDTVVVSIIASDDPTFNTGVETMRTATLTGANAAGVPNGYDLRCAPPSDSCRYYAATIVSGAGTTTMAALTAYLRLVS